METLYKILNKESDAMTDQEKAQAIYEQFQNELSRRETRNFLTGIFWGCIFSACIWLLLWWAVGGPLYRHYH